MRIFQGFLSATFFVTVMTCLLYVAGSTYIAGYLSAFGIEEGVFQHDFSYTIEKGGLVFFLGWIKLYIIAFFYSFAALLYAYLAHEIAKEDWIKNLVGKARQRLTGQKANEQKDAPAILRKILNIAAFSFLTSAILAATAYFYYCLIFVVV